MKTFFTRQITSRGFDWKLSFFAGTTSFILLVVTGNHSISTGKEWYIPIFFAFLAISNFRHAYRIRKKIKNSEPQTEPYSK